MSTEHTSVMTSVSNSKYDTVLLTGDGRSSRKVFGENKAFLEVGGLPIFIHVLKSLEKAATVDRICLTGPKEKLTRELDKHQHVLAPTKELQLLEQGDSLFANAWNSFAHLYPEAQDSNSPDSPFYEKAVLFIPGDIPLITPFEIDTFTSLCQVGTYDYFLGITPSENLHYFAPHKNTPGITTSYFHIKEGKYRQNNLHLVKPLKVHNRTYIQKVYDYRYQKDLQNIVRLAIEFLKVHVGIKGLWCYGLLHWHQFLSQVHLNFLTFPTRTLLPLSLIESCISRVLGTSFNAVISPIVGATLDIDNEKDYHTIQVMFSPWKNYQQHRE